MRFGVRDFSRLAHRADFKKGRIQCPFFILWNLPKGLFGEYFDVEVFKNSGRKPSEGFVKKSVRYLFNYQIDIRSGFPYCLR